MVKWNINERYPWSKVASFDGEASTEEVMTFRIYFDLDYKDSDGDDDNNNNDDDHDNDDDDA